MPSGLMDVALQTTSDTKPPFTICGVEACYLSCYWAQGASACAAAFFLFDVNMQLLLTLLMLPSDEHNRQSARLIHTTDLQIDYTCHCSIVL